MGAGAKDVRLPGADEQAASFGRSRSDHRNEIAEDYVELIADLIDAMGEALVIYKKALDEQRLAPARDEVAQPRATDLREALLEPGRLGFCVRHRGRLSLEVMDRSGRQDP